MTPALLHCAGVAYRSAPRAAGVSSPRFGPPRSLLPGTWGRAFPTGRVPLVEGESVAGQFGRLVLGARCGVLRRMVNSL